MSRNQSASDHTRVIDLRSILSTFISSRFRSLYQRIETTAHRLLWTTTRKPNLRCHPSANAASIYAKPPLPQTKTDHRNESVPPGKPWSHTKGKRLQKLFSMLLAAKATAATTRPVLQTKPNRHNSCLRSQNAPDKDCKNQHCCQGESPSPRYPERLSQGS